MSNHKSISVSELNNLLDISNRTIRHNLKKLKENKVIAISLDSKDLRKRIIKLRYTT